MKYLFTIIVISVTLLFGAYEKGRVDEKHLWSIKVEKIQEEVKQQEKASNENTKKLIIDYEDKIKTINQSYNIKLASRESVRVLDNCPRQEATSGETNSPSPEIPDLARETITQKEWEDENRRRFELNKAHLDTLIRFVSDLYDQYK